MKARTPEDDALRGILAMAISAFFFAVLTAIVKLLGTQYHVIQIVFFRCLFSFVPMLVLVRRRHRAWRLPPTERLWGHVVRTVVGLISMGCVFYSFTTLPLADALSITSSGPLFTALFAILILREQVGWRRWAAMAIGFVGVLIMAKPSGDVTLTGIAFALAGAIFYGFAMTSVRSLGKTEEPLTTIFFFSLLSTALTLIPLPFFWQTPTSLHWLIFIAIGIAAFFVQLFLTKAYYHASAAIVTPLNYTSIVWGAGLGYLFWGEIPTPRVAIGAALVMTAAALIAWRETRKSRGPVPPLAAT